MLKFWDKILAFLTRRENLSIKMRLAGIEPAQPAPEASALSVELQAHRTL